jgi:hypothetical protein
MDDQPDFTDEETEKPKPKPLRLIKERLRAAAEQHANQQKDQKP